MPLSPILQVFFERMNSGEFADFFQGRKLYHKLMKLRIALLSVIAVLEDAEEQRFTSPGVKEWLDKLEDVMCDAEEICDEIATKDLRQKLDAEFGTFRSKVRNPISTYRFVKNVERKIEYAVGILERLASQMEYLALREDVGRNLSEGRTTTSVVSVSDIFGRHDDKEAIINSLISDDDNICSDIGVIAIVGMGGIGKTTLAQLVYNEDIVKEHFDHRAWVCVSDEFDVLKVTKIIVKSMTLSDCDHWNLNMLQLKLYEMMRGKKFLLVLDDVWNEDYACWQILSAPFRHGLRGSKVIVTTRNLGVASVMFARTTHHVKELSKEDCWSLFTKHAFIDGYSNANLDLELGAIGRRIVDKCEGVPLAIKAVGALLRAKLDANDWEEVLRSELWDSPVGEISIIPALRLSYKYLSPHLKRCFAYCSIFPRDYAFKKDKLILLWMAEGFLLQPRLRTMEEIGNEYFLALVSRSLFQQSNHNSYIMPNLVYDLAKATSTRFTLSHEDDCSPENASNTRHFSYFYTKFHIEKFATFHGAKRLRTILQLNSNVQSDAIYRDVSQFSIPVLRSLRVLSLSHYQNITELSNSVSKLIHLRYLDLSYTGIKRLPDSICNLCNLQTLNLSNCWFLAALPTDLYKLINLHHLDFDKTRIMEMPVNMGELRCLQTLTKFIVGKHGGSGIGELGKLSNLQGSLPIFELQNVESPMDVNLREKYLKELNYLKELVLEWRVDANASESQRIVLDSLQPHTNLEILAINGYGGKRFPYWVGCASFSNITSLRLEYCTQCCELPPLGQLPSLQDLSIVGFKEVVTVGDEFYGSGSSSINPFEALKVLKFKYMLKWENWFSFDCENEGGAFPNLGELQIYECPMLTGSLPVNLPSSAKRDIHDCPLLVVGS